MLSSSGCVKLEMSFLHPEKLEFMTCEVRKEHLLVKQPPTESSKRHAVGTKCGSNGTAPSEEQDVVTTKTRRSNLLDEGRESLQYEPSIAEAEVRIGPSHNRHG